MSITGPGFVCVFLLSCFSSNIPLKNCPDHCQCYSAPEGGYGEDNAVSLSCDFVEPNQYKLDHFKSLKNINTFIINKLIDNNIIAEGTLSGLSINNLVFKDSKFHFTTANYLRGLNKDSLKVLTFLDSHLLFGGDDFSLLNDFKQIKAIHFSGGLLMQISKQFYQFPVTNVVSVKIDNTKLPAIDQDSFNNFKSLKMLTITRNLIKTLDWMLTIESPIWYLDLRDNQIQSFPNELAKKLTKLRTLKLGGNNIHVFTGDTINVLINQLTEFSFVEIKVDPAKKQYFFPTKDMLWVEDFIDSPSKFTNYPRFLYESIIKFQCIEWRKNVRAITCIDDLLPEQFTYPIEAITDQLVAVYGENQFAFSYMNEMTYLSGAVLPFDSTHDDLKILINKMVKGNTVKIHLNSNEWSKLPYNIQESDLKGFDEMIDNIEKLLQDALKKGVFIIISLWNSDQVMPELLDRSDLFDRYTTYHLERLVKRINNYKSLAAWNILDQPERLIKRTNAPQNSLHICDDTNKMHQAGTAKSTFSIKTVQNFIAKQAQIIHRNDPRKLITVTFSEKNKFLIKGENFNYFENQCLENAVNNICPDNDCTLDFYSILVDGNSRLYNENIDPVQFSSQSPKPILIIAEEYVVEIIKFYENIDTKTYHGVLGTFTRFDTVNVRIEDGMASAKAKIGKNILPSNFANPIL